VVRPNHARVCDDRVPHRLAWPGLVRFSQYLCEQFCTDGTRPSDLAYRNDLVSQGRRIIMSMQRYAALQFARPGQTSPVNMIARTN